VLDEHGLFHMFMAVDDLSQMLDMALDCCRTGSDPGLEALQASPGVFPRAGFASHVLVERITHAREVSLPKVEEKALVRWKVYRSAGASSEPIR
jgi:hypothetical protein